MSIDEKGQPMSKREAVIEAMRSAMEAVRDKKRPGVTYFLIPEMAEAALDAALLVLSEPDEGMVEAGVEHLFGWADDDPRVDARMIFSAMLSTLRSPEK